MKSLCFLLIPWVLPTLALAQGLKQVRNRSAIESAEKQRVVSAANQQIEEKKIGYQKALETFLKTGGGYPNAELKELKSVQTSGIGMEHQQERNATIQASKTNAEEVTAIVQGLYRNPLPADYSKSKLLNPSLEVASPEGVDDKGDDRQTVAIPNIKMGKEPIETKKEAGLDPNGFQKDLTFPEKKDLLPSRKKKKTGLDR